MSEDSCKGCAFEGKCEPSSPEEMRGDCKDCAVDSQKCPFNAPPKIDGFEHLDVDYKHHRIDCEHFVKRDK